VAQAAPDSVEEVATPVTAAASGGPSKALVLPGWGGEQSHEVGKPLEAGVFILGVGDRVAAGEPGLTAAPAADLILVIPIHCKPEEAVKLRDTLQPAVRVLIDDRPQI